MGDGGFSPGAVSARKERSPLDAVKLQTAASDFEPGAGGEAEWRDHLLCAKAMGQSRQEADEESDTSHAHHAFVQGSPKAAPATP